MSRATQLVVEPGFNQSHTPRESLARGLSHRLGLQRGGGESLNLVPGQSISPDPPTGILHKGVEDESQRDIRENQAIL